MSYKDTLNIPMTEFPMKASLSDNAKKFREFWDKENIYELINKRVYQKKFTLHDGPPYANGNIHLGHALNKVLKDFVLRYKSLTGHQIDYIPGWDTHGLPIENKLERTGQYKNKSPLEKRKACQEYALEQIKIQYQQFKKLHLLCNFKKIYKTLDKNFIKNELNVFYSFVEKNLLFWDLKPVAWSWSSKTALAESEIIYKPVESESIYFWFPLEDNFKDIPKDSRFLIWTTTPYTIEANLALSVNPDFTYLLIRNKNQNWIIVENQTKALNMEGKILKSFKGEYLNGAKYKNVLTEEINPVILANYVTKDTGTGIVHTAPALGLEDYYICQKNKINPYSCIKDDGYFDKNTKFPPISGQFYKDASKTIISWLRDKGYLIKTQNITHNIGHDWRTEKPILYKTSPQWFIDISKLKPQIKGMLSQVKSSPEWLTQKLEDLILSRNEWCISRQRSWGTPIPILFDENKPILDLRQIKHTIELLDKYGISSWYKKAPDFFLHPNTKITGKITASRDILDVWFDSGCSWNILPKKESDLYLEGFDQLRGWFNSSATISIAMQKRLPFKSLLAHGFILDGNGNKMSKSKGNVINPIEIVDKYGADILRLWLATNNYLEDIKLSDISLQNTITLYRKIRNTLFRYSLSILGNNFKPNKKILENLKYPENIYIYQLFRDTYRNTLKHLENFHFFKAIKTNINFLNTYSNWYLEICKDTLYCEKKTTEEYQEIINIIYEIFNKSLIFYSIFIPQTAEEAYSYTNKTYKSIFLEKLNNLEGKNYEISNKWKKFFELKNQVYTLIEDLKNKKIVANSQEVSLQLPEEKLIPGFNLKKYLNIAEISSGPEISISKCSLNKCDRCKKCAETTDNLCLRCVTFLREINK